MVGASICGNAQKPALTMEALKEWQNVGLDEISRTGAYVSYQIVCSSGSNAQVVVASTDGKWHKDLGSVSDIGFSGDERYFFYVFGKDSLKRLRTGSDSSEFFGTGQSMKLFSSGEKGWITYLQNGTNDSVGIIDINTSRRLSFGNIKEYILDPRGAFLLLKQLDPRDSSIHIRLVDLNAGSIVDIWSGSNDDDAVDFTFDQAGGQVAFLVRKRRMGDNTYELWAYSQGHTKASSLVTNSDLSDYKGLRLARSRLVFGSNGGQLFFGMSPIESKRHSESTVKMEIWSYLDPQLKSAQERWGNMNMLYYGVVDLTNRRVVRLEGQNELLIDSAGNYALVKHWLGFDGMSEASWNGFARESVYLVCTRDGSRRKLNVHAGDRLVAAAFSAGGRWVVYFDYAKRNYFSYEISTGITRNITRGIHTVWTVSENERPEPKVAWNPGRYTWLYNDRAVLIYDNFDIWQVDPQGIMAPLNVTNRYGIKHSLKFEIAVDQSTLLRSSQRRGGYCFVRAFNKRSKNMGFYKVQLDIQNGPSLCVMGPYVYGNWAGYGKAISMPIKAGSSLLFITIRQSAVQAPNLFATRDFRHFIQLSDIEPQRKYNWLTSELWKWKTFDGGSSTGILYKPENFDSTKKYPVIFDYYERRSDELNLYITPRPAADRINIAWFVSNGYLVFAPDIDYRSGAPGPSALNSIGSAAAYLARFHWVNRHKMGVQGHSFGGYETEYVITHTGIFAAACSASGFCDLVSWYLANPRGSYGMFWSEQDQGRLMTTLWATPERYIRNSPIFSADKVTTPLLMMNNKSDGNVSIMQGVEFFSALRRLGRRVWMLDYEDQRHSLTGEAAEDYTKRMTQFFDHYLKDAPAPEWMTRPVRYAKKYGNPDFEIERSIRTPGPGLSSLEYEK